MSMQSFQTELFSSFLPFMYADHVNLAAAKHCQTGNMAALLNSVFFVFNSFLPKYCVIYYDYIVKWCSVI